MAGDVVLFPKVKFAVKTVLYIAIQVDVLIFVI